jgi:hypothetical protein
MQRSPATATLIARIKRAAKARAKQGDAAHSDALEEGARQAGYASWHELQRAATGRLAEGADELRVDPALPPNFDNTPNEQRSDKELRTWWDRPFALTLPDGNFEVRCLDGGAWDRSTWYGVAPDLASAKALAREKLARWRQFRGRPTTQLDESGSVKVVRPPQHPHESFTVIKECGSMQEASEYIKSLAATDATEP